MTKPLDLSKPIQTRDGRKVRVVDTNLINGGRSILAVVTPEYGDEYTISVYSSGSIWEGEENKSDIINVKPKQTVYITLFTVHTIGRYVGSIVHNTEITSLEEAIAKGKYIFKNLYLDTFSYIVEVEK